MEKPDDARDAARDLLKGARETLEEVEEEREQEAAREETETAFTDAYTVTIRDVPFKVEVRKLPDRRIPRYRIRAAGPDITEEQKVDIRSELLRRVKPSDISINDMEDREEVEARVEHEVFNILEKLSISMREIERKRLAVNLVMEMIGLGNMEIPLHDGHIEEVCINSADEPVWVYHKQHGWTLTNITYGSEKDVKNVSEKIAATFGKEITTAHPILDDARLITGDRAAATLFPISTEGNTVTIRKFRREPWTITDMISPEVGTLTPDLAALLWLAIQYETNLLIAGGTASGKTSLLNALLMFVPPEQRIVSIEDVREIRLHKDAHWVPLAAREAYGEEAEEVSILRLMLLALRMRPDRIVLGEVRSQEEAQTLFEAAETGHSVYSTLHATTVDGIFRRLLNPPIDVPESMLASLQLAMIQYRQKREGFRRTIQAAEIVDVSRGKNVDLETNLMYKWRAKDDILEKVGESKRLIQHINFFSGLTEKEIEEELAIRRKILTYMLEHDIRSADQVSRTFHRFYDNRDHLIDLVEKEKRIPV